MSEFCVLSVTQLAEGQAKIERVLRKKANVPWTGRSRGFYRPSSGGGSTYMLIRCLKGCYAHWLIANIVSTYWRDRFTLSPSRAPTSPIYAPLTFCPLYLHTPPFNLRGSLQESRMFFPVIWNILCNLECTALLQHQLLLGLLPRGIFLGSRSYSTYSV
jgi:hypothetical protein